MVVEVRGDQSPWAGRPIFCAHQRIGVHIQQYVQFGGEYLFDERADEAPTPFEDDLFIGVRLALNDVQSTSILAGAIIDRETGSNSVGVEGNRRLWESWTVDVEARAIIGTERTELLHGLRKDDYVQVQLARHF